MKAAVLILAGAVVASSPSLADLAPAGSGERIAAHFEASSSRLRAEDVHDLERFVQRVENTPGAKLSVLFPSPAEPARTRFVAARIAELERRVPALSDIVEYRRDREAVRGDVVWLTIVLPEAAPVPQPVSLEPAPVPAPIAAPPPLSKPVAAASDLQLTDWVVRGVKHPAHGPTYAYVAKAGSSSAPHEVVEAQTDKDLGLIREISLSPDGLWVVRTEIGWIGQIAP